MSSSAQLKKINQCLLQLFYSLLSLSFKINLTFKWAVFIIRLRTNPISDFFDRFGDAGFLVFWMVNWVGMLSVYVLLDHQINIGLIHIPSGLALESLITILTTRYIPFFMILLIIGMIFLPLCPLPILISLFSKCCCVYLPNRHAAPNISLRLRRAIL
jgi:hypothetical protein